MAANLAAAEAPGAACSGRAYNVAGGAAYSLLQLLEILEDLTGRRAVAAHTDPRPGYVRHSRADIAAARADLGHQPRVGFEEGLRHTLAWFEQARATRT